MTDQVLKTFATEDLIDAIAGRQDFTGVIVWRTRDEYHMSKPALQEKPVTIALLSHAFDVVERNG